MLWEPHQGMTVCQGNFSSPAPETAPILKVLRGIRLLLHSVTGTQAGAVDGVTGTPRLLRVPPTGFSHLLSSTLKQGRAPTVFSHFLFLEQKEGSHIHFPQRLANTFVYCSSSQVSGEGGRHGTYVYVSLDVEMRG